MNPAAPELLVGALFALPWVFVPAIGAWRSSLSTSLDDEPASLPEDAPLVTVIVPARDEARNIERCLRSLLHTDYPRVEVIVVDDHSSDDTASLVRRIASEDTRVRLLEAMALPEGWFGKPWACATGADAAHGEILCFADADTVQAPDLLPRTVHAMRRRGAEMLSVAGSQELGTFWEVVLQPQVFAMLSLRYGGTEIVNRSNKAYDKIANGQCIVITREAYVAAGGHAAVRGEVAEDLMLAQRVFVAGHRQALVLGVSQLSTRMYESLDEIVRGWRKNIFAGGAKALPNSLALRLLFPFILLLFPALELLPPFTLLRSAFSMPGVQAWATVATTASLVSWAVLYRHIGRSMWYALAYPIGGAVLLWIIIGAIARGRRVSWKGRQYRAA